MSTAEITAYLYGAERAGEYRHIAGYLTEAKTAQRAQLDPLRQQAFDKLKGDRWNHWVARGFWEARGAGHVVPEV